MISNDQRKLYWANLHAVMQIENGRASVPASPDQFRAAFHAQHNLPASTKDFTKQHFDTFLAACAAITQPAALKPQLRAFDQPKTRLLHKILVEQAAMLDALYAANDQCPMSNAQSSMTGKTGQDTILHICADKFKGRKPADLNAEKWPDPEDPNRFKPSQLEMLMFTVARTIKELRQKAGWTQHELLWAAGLGQTCSCADCRKGRVRARLAKTSARTARVLAPAAEELANAPF